VQASNVSVPQHVSEDAVTALAEFFGGDRALFDAFRSACLVQLPLDVLRVDQALAHADVVGCRHVVHSLKSVLLTLGHPRLSALAHAAEQSAARGDVSATQMDWQRLRAALLADLDLQVSFP